jgi:hypothetical protein
MSPLRLRFRPIAADVGCLPRRRNLLRAAAQKESVDDRRCCLAIRMSDLSAIQFCKHPCKGREVHFPVALV